MGNMGEVGVFLEFRGLKNVHDSHRHHILGQTPDDFIQQHCMRKCNFPVLVMKKDIHALFTTS